LFAIASNANANDQRSTINDQRNNNQQTTTNHEQEKASLAARLSFIRWIRAIRAA
jgi:hypothetical protein